MSICGKMIKWLWETSRMYEKILANLPLGKKMPTEYKTEGQSTNQAILEKRIILATRGMGEKNIPECDKR